MVRARALRSGIKTRGRRIKRTEKRVYLDLAGRQTEAYGNSFFSGSLPASFAWQVSYQSAVLAITPVSAVPQFMPPSLAGPNLVLTGNYGNPGHQYRALAGPDVSAPLQNWTPVFTNTFVDNGQFSYNASVNPSKSWKFYIIVSP